MDRKIVAPILLIMLALTIACSLPFTIISRDAYIATLVEQTVQKLLVEEILPTPIPTNTPIPASQAEISLPTFTPQVAPLTNPISCYQAVFVSETVPDGTTFKPGQSFTKSWRLRNVGACTWQSNFRFIFFSGNQMNSPNYILLGKTVEPSQQVDIAINLIAPRKTGTYKGYWRLQANNGELYGQVFSQIKVAASAAAPTATKVPPFAVTSVTSNGTNQSPVTCTGYVYDFNTTISANAPGSVTYRIDDSLSGAGTLQSVVFATAGSKTIAQSKSFSGSGAHAISVYVDNPNHQKFGPFFTVTCPSAFAVTNVELSAVQNDPSVTCGQDDTFTTTAIITANGPGVVSYNWEMETMSDWQESLPESVTFDAAGAKTVQYTWTTATISWGEFKYYFLKNLPAPADSYYNLIEMQCN